MKSRGMLLLLLTMLLGCKQAERPAPPLPAPVVPTTPAASAPAVPAPPAPAHPKTCEVEMGGLLQFPKGQVPAKGTTYVYVADNDCLAADAHVLGRSQASKEGSFFIEVFPRWGADLTLCAAHEVAPGQPSKLYGKAAGPMHAEATGEVTFGNLRIAMRPGAAHRFPAPAGDAQAR